MDKAEFNKTVKAKVEYWKRKLIDLSKRNNLVSYRFTKSKSIKIVNPHPMQAIEDLREEGKISFLIENEDNPGKMNWICSEEKEIISKKLYKLYLVAKSNFQELGVNTCFVSLFSLRYKEAKDSDITRQAPIFLYSIQIEKTPQISKKYHNYDIIADNGDIQLNPALVEKLNHDYGIVLKEFDGEDIQGYLEYLKTKIQGIEASKIVDEVIIDIFSYQKYIMYKDLIKHEKLTKENNLVRAYIGDRNALQDEMAEALREEFDDTTSPDVLPADSSQKRAVELAKAGVTFVLQGPPGTGKSQTIVNIISALIQQKKKVLFVSQKMAALNVVQKRLDDVGLGRYCLNLHTYRGNKKEVVRQLMRELETSPKITDTALNYSFSNYLNSMKKVNEYYEFLGKKRKPVNLSIYEIKGKIALLDEVDDEVIKDDFSKVLEFDSEKMSAQIELLKRINSILAIVPDPLNNPLYKYKSELNTVSERKKFLKSIQNTTGLIDRLFTFLIPIEKKCKLVDTTCKALNEISSAEKIVNSIKKINDFFLCDDFEKLYEEFERFCGLLEKEEFLFKDIKESVADSFVDSNTSNQEKILRETGILKRLFNKEYKDAIHKLSEYSKEKISHSKWIDLFDKKSDLMNTKKDIDKLNKKHDFDKLNVKHTHAECKQVFDDNHKLKDAFSLFYSLQLKNFKHFVENLKESNGSIGKINKEIGAELSEISKYIGNDIKECETLRELHLKIKEIIDTGNHLNEVLLFKEQFASLHAEIKVYVEQYLQSKTKHDLLDIFYKKYWSNILDSIISKQNILPPKDLIELIRNDDFEVRNNLRYQIMDTIEKSQPNMNFSSAGSNELFILKREAQKKRRLKPVRDLLTEIPNLVFVLKPCFMMSPLTVSQYINPELVKFDVVIFDEASQIMPEDAVPCLLRAKQAIIMGDTQQLPPTSFFLSNQDDFDEDEIEDLDSFLSEASTKFREKSLEWHYRSNDEHLIAFSNRFFYDNRLITFPNSNQEKVSGLEYIYVNGVYDRGKSRKNRDEAKKVVELYQKLCKEKKSIGIIAFSMAQENAIREEFMARGIKLDESIDASEEEVFVKNLETVQGDERDIIIISVGYGKDSSGKLSYNFGPLNKSGGYKRLNVAITRSRYKTIIISSIKPGELDEDKINSDNVRFLKNYLDYAKNKDFSKFITGTEHLNFDSSFEESVYNTLVKEGFDVSCQVGCSGYRVDLGIKNTKKKGEYVLGVECDGAQYHSSRYARDRDKVRQIVLERLGWNIHRIWSDDWLNNKPYEIEKIKNRVDALMNIKSKGDSQKKETFEAVEEVSDFNETALNEHFDTYKVADLPMTRTKIEFDGYGYLSYGGTKAMEVMLKVLEIESPIEKELLYKRTLQTFGIQKLGSRLRRTFDYLLQQLKKQYSNIYIYGETVSIDKIDKFTNVRVSKEEDRPFAFIPKEELAGAIMEILKNAFSSDEKTLIKDIARNIYGNNRTGTKIDKKVKEAIKYSLKEGLIEADNGKIKLKRN